MNQHTERILYLTPEQSILEVARGLYNAVAAALGLGDQTSLSAQAIEAKAPDVSLSPVLHLCAYERGEESLVNDYEEIITMARQGGSEIVEPRRQGRRSLDAANQPFKRSPESVT